jgi:hypothetical protein
VSKWRVTFEVDLGDSIPKQEDLKPHDYPLHVWAGQAVFDMIFKFGSCEALAKTLKIMCNEKDEATKRSMLAHYERIHELCEAAAKTAKVEEIK